MRHFRNPACALALALIVSPALAAGTPSDDELSKVKKTLSDWGCTGGEVKKEAESGGVYEIDDATCKDGNKFDVKLDQDFAVISFSRY